MKNFINISEIPKNELRKILEWIEQAETMKLGGKHKDADKNLLHGFCKKTFTIRWTTTFLPY